MARNRLLDMTNLLRESERMGYAARRSCLALRGLMDEMWDRSEQLKRGQTVSFRSCSARCGWRCAGPLRTCKNALKNEPVEFSVHHIRSMHG
ncbi:hypothetical protein BURKHO8Y_510010 [Burkholderia sp. 8Y]|nr:hypothetical protein BURKHO8Y_510010 [Burkholderia sp. 8Y]